MKTPRSISLSASLLLAVMAIALLPLVRGDPSITAGGQGSLDAAWNFQNPANYTLNNTVIQGGVVSLRRSQAWWNSTTKADFANYSSAVNIDLNSRPGNVVLNNTTIGTATYTSRVAGNGKPVSWNSIAWSASSFDNLSDDFNGSSLAPRWSWFNPPSSYSVGSPRPGWLTFNATKNTDFWNGVHSGQLLYQPVTGDFQVDARLQTSPLTASGEKAGIMVMWTPTSWGSIYRAYSGNIRLQAVTTLSGNSNASATIAANPDYLRVKRTGSVLETYYSLDGITWTFLSTIGIGILPATLWIGVMGADPSSTASLTLNVDYVHYSFANANPLAQVETRTGNSTNTADPSWTPWSSPYANPNGSSMALSGAYLQYRILLSTSSIYVRPYAGGVSISWRTFAPRGDVLTQDFRSGKGMVWDLLAVTTNLQGGAVNVSYSFNGGNWTRVLPGSLSLTMADALRLRLTLSTPDGSKSPTVRELRVSLNTPSSPSPPFPWGLVAIAVFLALAPIPPILYTRRPDVKDVFLIQKDGILVAHVSRGDTLEKDQDTLAATLTVIQDFVSQSFTYGKGQHLNRLEMGEYKVALEMDPKAYLAAIYSGRGRILISLRMRMALRRIDARYGKFLDPWRGDMKAFEGVAEYLKPLFGGGGPRESPALSAAKIPPDPPPGAQG